jgi:acyl carrier protein
MTPIELQISVLIAKVSQRPAPADADESLFDSGMLDSFTLTDLVGELEKAFGIKVPDADLKPRRFDSVARIAAYVEKAPRVMRAG